MTSITPAESQRFPVNLAERGDYVSWVARGTETSTSRAIRRVRKDGTGGVEELATTDGVPKDLAVDDRFVYWVTTTNLNSSGGLYRVAY